MFHWLHHLLNPHCPECALEKQEDKVCSSCEVLKMQLSIANAEKQRLLDSIIEFTKKPEAPASPPVDWEKLKPKVATWNVRKQMLEAEDRATAKILAEQKTADKEAQRRDIERLEKEIGLDKESEVKLGEEVKADA